MPVYSGYDRETGIQKDICREIYREEMRIKDRETVYL